MWQKAINLWRAQVRGRGRPDGVSHKDGRDILYLTVRFSLFPSLLGGQVCSLCCDRGSRWRSDSRCFVLPLLLSFQKRITTATRSSLGKAQEGLKRNSPRREGLSSRFSFINSTSHLGHTLSSSIRVGPRIRYFLFPDQVLLSSCPRRKTARTSTWKTWRTVPPRRCMNSQRYRETRRKTPTAAPSAQYKSSCGS